MSLRSLSLVLLALLTLLGCAANRSMAKKTVDEIDAYVKLHPDLPELDKQCIYDGRFEVGLKKETVSFLLGEPKDIEIVHQPWATQENWVYNKAGVKIFIIEDSHVVGIKEE